MSIVFLILKIIGIVLLSLIGLAVLVLLTVLLVPVRYRILGEVKEEWESTVQLRLSWLLHAVSFRAGYQEKELWQKLKIFGIPVSFEKPGGDQKIEKKKSNRKKKSDKKRRKQQKSARGENDTAPENLPQEPEIRVPEAKEQRVPEPIEARGISTEPVEARRISPEPVEARGISPEPVEARGISPEPAGTKMPFPKVQEAGEETISPRKKKDFFLCAIFRKIKSIPGMIKSKWETLKEKARSFQELWERIKKEWQDENNRNAIKLLWRELKNILRHFLPNKIKADAVFSTGEPDTTGQALGVISTLPFIYRYQIRLVPDFEAEQFYFKGTFDIKGHIRGIHAVILLFHLIKDKNIRSIIQRYSNS